MEQIERSSIDFYATTRSLYRQNRAAQINGGKAPDGSAELLIVVCMTFAGSSNLMNCASLARRARRSI